MDSALTVVLAEEQIPAGTLHVTLTLSVVRNQHQIMLTSRWVITLVTGEDQSSATVTISGLVLPMHHSLLVDLVLHLRLLTAGTVVDAGTYHTV